MISNLSRPSIAFTSKELTSPRNAYDAKKQQIEQIGQQQNYAALNPSSTPPIVETNQISMQGNNAQGQKLNVIA